MTSFDIFESSEEGSRPLEIYTITVGTTTYRYTSNASDITIGANTWTAVPIRRTKIASSTDRNDKLTLTFPGDNEFAKSFLGATPGSRSFVNIIRLQRDEVPTFDTQALIYKGQVAAGSYDKDGTSIKLTATSVEAAAQRKIPRFTFMGMCNHILFDSRCKKSVSGFLLQEAPTVVAAQVLTVPGASAYADGFFAGGWCKPTTESDYRLILSHTGSTLTLLLPFSSDVTGVQLDIYAGCDHVFNGDCTNKFDNGENFGGFPFVPNKNIFATGLD